MTQALNAAGHILVPANTTGDFTVSLPWKPRRVVLLGSAYAGNANGVSHGIATLDQEGVGGDAWQLTVFRWVRGGVGGNNHVTQKALYVIDLVSGQNNCYGKVVFPGNLTFILRVEVNTGLGGVYVFWYAAP